MKYRHAYHAGNFADVHKHVTLTALLEAMQRKDKGFLYFDTHAGSGLYDLHATQESQTGYRRIADKKVSAEELTRYKATIKAFRQRVGDESAYPGSPVIAAEMLRDQDRAIFVEQVAAESRALERALPPNAKTRVEVGDGFAVLKAHLPPAERRGLILIDPPYEEAQQDYGRVGAAINDALRRFQTAVIAAWYPIKDARDIASWHASLAKGIPAETLVSELWLFPTDSRVALNGSGMLIVHPPYRLDERMQVWLKELHGYLDTANSGGWRVRSLTSAPL